MMQRQSKIVLTTEEITMIKDNQGDNRHESKDTMRFCTAEN
jgi:hypothetical protein